MRTKTYQAGKAALTITAAAALYACGGGGGGGGDSTSPSSAASASLPTAGVTGTGTSAAGTTTGAAGASTGATDSTARPAAGTVVTASGVMRKGSVIVNGIHFQNTRSRFRINDRDATADAIRDGMMVTVRGRLNDDGVSGEAELVEVENELRGMASSVSAAAQTFSVGGVQVVVDSATIYANLPTLSLSGVQDQYVEVHGPRDAAGVVHASRVEGQARGVGEGIDELRGTVNETAAGRFALGSVIVTHTGGTIAAGTLVEVHGTFTGNNAFAATHVDLEDQEDARLRPAEGERTGHEGFVTNLDAAQRAFMLNGRTVQFTAATEIRGGTAGELVDGARVEVHGTVVSGVLAARQIRFKQNRVLIDGKLLGRTGAGSGTVSVLNKTVSFDADTRIDARRSGGGTATIADIVAGTECVSIRAVEKNGQLTAERITEPSNCRADEDLVQARITGVNKPQLTVTILDNIAVDLSRTAVFRNVSGASITRDQFFALVNAAGNSVVKVKGTFSNGTLTAAEAEVQS